jgi:GH43 family beta-xylosidase
MRAAPILEVAFTAASLCGCSSGGLVDDDISDDGADQGPLELGLRGEYFREYHERVLDRVDPVVDFVWADGELAPGTGADRVSIRWTGFLDVPVAGSYTFATSNDDGVRVTVNDAAVIDDWRFHFPERHEGTLELPAGMVPLAVEYFEVDLHAEMRLSWSSTTAGVVDQIIPNERLRAARTATGLPSVKPPYANPVLDQDCPDPGVARAGDAFYMACTGGSFPIRRSPDLVMWTTTPANILPDGKAPWSANGGRNWAPEIHEVGGHFVAYFTAVNGANVLSVGAASAPAIEGPYTDRGGPLVEHPQGVIDASYFRDTGGTPYLLYKIDGNSQGQPTPIFLRELAADGLSFAPGSTQVELLRNAPATWEGGVVEAPWLVRHDDTYYLFYSGNVYDHRYRTGVARASSIRGPYEKHGAPILANNARWVGPGHGSVVPIGSELYFVYHAWAADGQGTAGPGGRRVLVDAIDWVDGWPRISDGTPSASLQTWPGN